MTRFFTADEDWSPFLRNSLAYGIEYDHIACDLRREEFNLTDGGSTTIVHSLEVETIVDLEILVLGIVGWLGYHLE